MNHRHTLTALTMTVWLAALGLAIAATPPAKTKASAPRLASPEYKPHDRKRPRPTVVTPPTASTQDQPGLPPSDATILFDGKDLSKWMEWTAQGGGNPAKPGKWIVRDGYTEAFGNQIETREKFADCHIHFEWQTSPEEAAQGTPRVDQHLGNSGFEIGDHPEIQILDSHENDTYPDGQAASIYGCWPPLVNASRKPGQWQSYDIFYLAPRFAEGRKVHNAVYTVLHNGLPVHHYVEVKGEETECHLRFRPHGGKLRYRNIWVRPLHQYDENKGKPFPPGARTVKPDFLGM